MAGAGKLCDMSFMRFRNSLRRPGACETRLRSYGEFCRFVQSRLRAAAAGAAIVALSQLASPATAADAPVKIVALGDSLTAGFGLPQDAAFPVKLAKALAAKGIAVDITNAGVSGDTTSGGLSRVDWSIPDGTDAVILELGANDMLRGIDPKVTREALESIVKRLKERGLAVLLCGMLAPPNYGTDYVKAYDAIFPDLAAKYGLVFYPFFLDGVVQDRSLSQADGLHPTAAGVDRVVERILPKAEELIAQVKTKRGS